MAVSATSSRSPSPDLLNIQHILRQDPEFSRTTIKSTLPLPDHLHRIYQLQLSNGHLIFLKGNPSSRIRLLRHEHNSLETEAASLSFLKQSTDLPLPRLIHYQRAQGLLPSQPYMLTTRVPGVNLSTLSGSMPDGDLEKLHRQLGREFRKLTDLTSKSFGPIHRVRDGRGWSSWREAFTWMMEAVLNDSEEGLVNLPYEFIRDYVRDLGPALDEITEASLLRLDPWDERKIFVDEQTHDLTGLVGWTHVIWGDPFAMDIFVRYPNQALFDGFGQAPLASRNFQRRMLLYLLYHAVKAVGTQGHRARSDHKEREGRKMLTWALMQLANV